MTERARSYLHHHLVNRVHVILPFCIDETIHHVTP